MNLAHRQRRMPAIVIGALAAAAVVVAGIRGSGQAAIVVALVIALLAAHVVRHQVRARLLYKRQANSPDTADPASPGHPARHGTTATKPPVEPMTRGDADKPANATPAHH